MGSMGAKQLHLISDGKRTLAEFAHIAALVEQYVDVFHIREKTITARELCAGITEMLTLGIAADRIIVNDRADAAAVMGVCGVHLAYHSLDAAQVKARFPELRAGKSVHSTIEAMQAEAAGVDYVMFGHVFPTASKANLPARGLEALQQVVQQVRVPVLAIGGIYPTNVSEVLAAGAAGIAVMSGILDADDPVMQAARYKQYIQAGRSEIHDKAL